MIEFKSNFCHDYIILFTLIYIFILAVTFLSFLSNRDAYIDESRKPRVKAMTGSYLEYLFGQDEDQLVTSLSLTT